MKYNVYSMKDKLRGFTQPNLDVNDFAAKRGFSVAINEGPKEYGFAPQDFDLYKVAEFDTDSGVMEAIIPVEFICNGMEVFNEK